MANLDIFTKKLLSLGMRNHYSNASLELTYRCNAHCEYCYIGNKSRSDLSTEAIFAIIDKLANAGIMNLTFTGGEPFIRDDFNDIFRYAISKGFWKIAVYTNGTLINDHHMELLIKYADYIGVLQISVFSHIPQIHDDYVGIPGALSKIISTAKQSKEAGVPVSIAVNVLDINYTSINETLDYFAALDLRVGVGIHKIINPISMERQSLRKLRTIGSFEFLSTMLECMHPRFLYNEKKRFTQAAQTYQDSDNFHICQGILTTICIDPGGDLLPCSSFRNLCIGNIFDPGSLFEIVNKSDILKKIKSLRRSDIKNCKTCKHVSVCNICIGQIHTETGTLEEPSKQLCHYAEALEMATIE